MTSGRVGELEVIRRIRVGARTRNPAVRVGIGDDCAVLKVLQHQELVVTTDFCLEGRHFRRDWHTAESAGHRCLARGLSDVAAMGARPVAAFLSLALPKGFDEEWFAGFMAGFERLASEFRVELAGGDTSQAPGEQILADVMAVGVAGRRSAIQRAGAQAGDSIWVTGSLGGAAAELKAMEEGTAWEFEGHPQSFPRPRVEAGLSIARRGLASAMIDLSDGLSTDLRHLCEASGVRALIDLEKVPAAEGATMEQALHGGEDYELLFTVTRGVRAPKQLGAVRLTKIGKVVGGEGPLVELVRGGELKAGGWEHLTDEDWSQR